MNYIWTALIVIAIIGIFFGDRFMHHADPGRPPAACSGVLDLRGWDFERRGEASLDGDWEFYWNQLLEPADFAGARGNTSPQPTGTIQVPRSWQGYRAFDQKLTGDGFATYRLKLLLPNTDMKLGLFIPQLYTAYKMWANGRLISSAGRVGQTRRTMTPRSVQRVIACRPTGGQLDLVIQVSNFHHRRGGIWRSIQLGPYDRVKQENNMQKAFCLLLMGSFLLMALYNLSLYFSLRQGPAPLLLGVFFGIGVLRLTLVGPVFYTLVFPHFDWELAMKLEYFTFYFCGPVFYLMIRYLYPAEIPRLFIRVTGWAAVGFAAVTILTPARVYTHLAPLYQVILLGGVTYMVIILGLVSVKRREYLMIGVFAVIVLSLFNDVLFYNNLVGAEFPMIPLVERLDNLSFWPRRIPAGFISMAFFIFIFNLLTLKMTRNYFSKSGNAVQQEIAPSLVEEYDLSLREVQVIRYLVKGYSNKEISAKLSITEGTVKVHLHNIYRKTGVGNRTELSHLVRMHSAEAEEIPS